MSKRFQKLKLDHKKLTPLVYNRINNSTNSNTNNISRPSFWIDPQDEIKSKRNLSANSNLISNKTINKTLNRTGKNLNEDKTIEIFKKDRDKKAVGTPSEDFLNFNPLDISDERISHISNEHNSTFHIGQLDSSFKSKKYKKVRKNPNGFFTEKRFMGNRISDDPQHSRKMFSSLR